MGAAIFEAHCAIHREVFGHRRCVSKNSVWTDVSRFVRHRYPDSLDAVVDAAGLLNWRERLRWRTLVTVAPARKQNTGGDAACRGGSCNPVETSPACLDRRVRADPGCLGDIVRERHLDRRF